MGQVDRTLYAPQPLGVKGDKGDRGEQGILGEPGRGLRATEAKALLSNAINDISAILTQMKNSSGTFDFPTKIGSKTYSISQSLIAFENQVDLMKKAIATLSHTPRTQPSMKIIQG
ncbi:hypothetical protein [Helicobacter cetorum]|uniref:Uncharacterized protein n=1 Tax=Helicobacter cetorum (strain ATCC BAA-540 / CCUG 52418 / MIT 99-5656) TaxID=1163745 RepID=I0ERS4_HELCM|nr:hypothetical protein [Helicobacter cetorum]AFI05643.1 hypothetical protein HCD_03135 [Helicobacter cetorum MIT 99-5656]